MPGGRQRAALREHETEGDPLLLGILFLKVGRRKGKAGREKKHVLGTQASLTALSLP